MKSDIESDECVSKPHTEKDEKPVVEVEKAIQTLPAIRVLLLCC